MSKGLLLAFSLSFVTIVFIPLSFEVPSEVYVRIVDSKKELNSDSFNHLVDDYFSDNEISWYEGIALTFKYNQIVDASSLNDVKSIM